MTNIFKLYKESADLNNSDETEKVYRSSRLSNLFDVFKIKPTSFSKNSKSKPKNDDIDHDVMIEAARKII